MGSPRQFVNLPALVNVQRSTGAPDAVPRSRSLPSRLSLSDRQIRLRLKRPLTGRRRTLLGTSVAWSRIRATASIVRHSATGQSGDEIAVLADPPHKHRRGSSALCTITCSTLCPSGTDHHHHPGLGPPLRLRAWSLSTAASCPGASWWRPGHTGPGKPWTSATYRSIGKASR
jgi:hypothetical protein